VRSNTHLLGPARLLQAPAQQVGKEGRRHIKAHLLVVQRRAEQGAADQLVAPGNSRRRRSLHRMNICGSTLSAMNLQLLRRWNTLDHRAAPHRSSAWRFIRKMLQHSRPAMLVHSHD